LPRHRHGLASFVVPRWPLMRLYWRKKAVTHFIARTFNLVDPASNSVHNVAAQDGLWRLITQLELVQVSQNCSEESSEGWQCPRRASSSKKHKRTHTGVDNNGVAKFWGVCVCVCVFRTQFRHQVAIRRCTRVVFAEKSGAVISSCNVFVHVCLSLRIFVVRCICKLSSAFKVDVRWGGIRAVKVDVRWGDSSRIALPTPIAVVVWLWCRCWLVLLN